MTTSSDFTRGRRAYLLHALVITAALSASLILLPGARQASAHNLGSDSIRYNDDSNGGQMIYESHSRWRREIGHASYWWQDLDCRWSGCPGVHVFNEKSGLGGSETLEIWDYCNQNSAILARWSDAPDPDRIYFNSCALDDYYSFKRRKVATHEFGHALRLNHPGNTSYYCENSIMTTGFCTPYNTPRPHDDSDYYNYHVN